MKFLGLIVRKIWNILCVCVSRPVTLTLTFDLLTFKLVRNVAPVTGYPRANFGDTTSILFRFMGHWANMAQTDYVTDGQTDGQKQRLLPISLRAGA